ncbi:flavoprotein [Plantactinospora sp. CA-294935]|uniref:flavoprotein n=1 Tax=Plantactinospora sp. CA-294935 TaxID=3240012 RepID=UPI003D8F4206
MKQRSVLYLVVCAAPPVLQIQDLVDLLREGGWTVWVIATPTAVSWIDPDALAQRTGNPVRSDRRKPDQPDLLPKADALLVAPATFNTINKWALGISDTLALGILNEVLGQHVPILVSPYAKTALTAHPAYDQHVRTLSTAGVLFTPSEALRPPTPNGHFQWRQLAEALSQFRVDDQDHR